LSEAKLKASIEEFNQKAGYILNQPGNVMQVQFENFGPSVKSKRHLNLQIETGIEDDDKKQLLQNVAFIEDDAVNLAEDLVKIEECALVVGADEEQFMSLME
jgi:hypothetical protein